MKEQVEKHHKADIYASDHKKKMVRHKIRFHKNFKG